MSGSTWRRSPPACGAAALALALLAPSGAPRAWGDGGTAAPVATAATAVEAAAPLRPAVSFDRVAFVGASVTAGFMTFVERPDERAGDRPETRGAGADPAPALRRVPVGLPDFAMQALATPVPAALASGNILFFGNPETVGRAQLGAAAAAQPTLLVGVDFLFWYGYGIVPEESARLARLEIGLAALDAFQCPIVVGDFPDMSEAVGRMLSARQMPAAETLQRLNARLREWAAARPRVSVFPLADLVTRLRSGGPVEVAGHRWSAEEAARLLQQDRLHPTVEGMAALALQLVEVLRAYDPTLPETAFLRDPKQIEERVRGGSGSGSGSRIQDSGFRSRDPRPVPES